MVTNGWQPKDPEVARLRDRLLAVEAALTGRVTALEDEVNAWQTRQAATRTEHRTRSWQLALAIITGLVLPLASIGIIALLHLISQLGGCGSFSWRSCCSPRSGSRRSS